MKKLFTIFTLLLCLNMAAMAAKNSSADSDKALFQDGDRVAFVGNSITHGGFFWPFVMTYYATRFPERNITFFNIGISGDNAGGLVRRMNSDILPHNPTVSVLMIGMNDVSRGMYLPGADTVGRGAKAAKVLETYKAAYKTVVDSLKAHSRELILLTPSIYDQESQVETPNNKGVNDVLYTFGEYIKSIAPSYNATLVDMWAETNKINRAIIANDPTKSVLRKDRVHPDEPGSLVMAYEFLKDTKAPKYVSLVEINAKSGKVTETENCKVSNVKVSKNGNLSFEMLEGSLPYPVNAKAMSILEYIPFVDDFNNEIVRVQGLKKGTYALSIGDAEVGEYSSSELADGINLAMNDKTPQYQQAQKVWSAVGNYRNMFNRYRMVVAIDHFRMKDFAGKDDPAACVAEAKKQYDALPENQKKMWAGNALQVYIKEKGRQKEYFEEVMAAGKAVYKINKPVSYTYKLTAK